MLTPSQPFGEHLTNLTLLSNTGLTGNPLLALFTLIIFKNLDSSFGRAHVNHVGSLLCSPRFLLDLVCRPIHPWLRYLGKDSSARSEHSVNKYLGRIREESLGIDGQNIPRPIIRIVWSNLHEDPSHSKDEVSPSQIKIVLKTGAKLSIILNTRKSDLALDLED